MAITYSYTGGSTSNLNRLRFLLGDHRGVAGTYATIALFIDPTNGAKALFMDEELNDCLTLASNNLMIAARLAMQCRMNKEAQAAGVSGTTDTSDRPGAVETALRRMDKFSYPATTSENLPQLETTSNDDLDDREGDLET